MKKWVVAARLNSAACNSTASPRHRRRGFLSRLRGFLRRRRLLLRRLDGLLRRGRWRLGAAAGGFVRGHWALTPAAARDVDRDARERQLPGRRDSAEAEDDLAVDQPREHRLLVAISTRREDGELQP